MYALSIVRLAEPGCEPNCIEWIAAQGRIDTTTPAEFKRVLGKLGRRKLPILIDSTGGAVDEGIAIGRLVRAKGLDVVVTKTVLTPCEATDQECRKLRARGVELGKRYRAGLPGVAGAPPPGACPCPRGWRSCRG